jgi:hypothetical protein
MRRLAVLAACLVALAGCASPLAELAQRQADFLAELEWAMPAAVEAHELALRGVLAEAQRAEEQALANQQVEVLKGVIDAAIAGARLDLAQPTRDAVKATLERLVKYHQDQQGLVEAARAAREDKARAVREAISTLSASVPALVAHERTIANYLEAQGGLLPLGGASITEPIADVGDLIGRLKTMGRTMDEQFARAKEVFEAAKKAAAGSEKP